MSIRTLYLAGCCFWGTQRFFDQFDGIINTEVGYANGPTENPTYKDVCASSGHAETVKVVFDDALISARKLLEYYFMVIDPISINRQGGDTGIQYRTGIYYDDDSLLPTIRAVFDEEQKKYSQPLAVELLPLEKFFSAEEYHQKYLEKNPTGYCYMPSSMLKLE